MMMSTEKDKENPLPSASDEVTTNSGDNSDMKKVLKEVELTATKPSLGKLFALAKPEIPMLLVSLVFMIGSEATNLVTPLIVANAYDLLVDTSVPNDDKRMSDINDYMSTAIGVAIGGILTGFLRASIQGMVGERVVARLRCKLYAQILNQEIAFFDEHKSGELVSRLGSDTTLLQKVISEALPDFCIQLLKAVATMGLMFYLSSKLAGVALGGVILIFMISAPLVKITGRLSKEYQDILGQAQTHSTEAIGSMRTVQAFAAEKKESNRYNYKIGNPDEIKWWWPPRSPRTTYRVGFFKSLTVSGFFTFVFGAGFGFLNVTLWYGFYLVLQGEMTLGDLTAFNSYIGIVAFAMGQVANSISQIYEGTGASGRVFYLMDRVPEIPKPPAKENAQPETMTPETMEGNIEFENVCFHYASRPDREVLNDVSLKMPANSTTAL
eukprot:scaffold586_cov68-Cylindrotheca_fusiformis.AAC.19